MSKKIEDNYYKQMISRDYGFIRSKINIDSVDMEESRPGEYKINELVFTVATETKQTQYIIGQKVKGLQIVV